MSTADITARLQELANDPAVPLADRYDGLNDIEFALTMLIDEVRTQLEATVTEEVVERDDFLADMRKYTERANRFHRVSVLARDGSVGVSFGGFA